jgi:ABC-type uncharacterized transport system substrate-binding protein
MRRCSDVTRRGAAFAFLAACAMLFSSAGSLAQGPFQGKKILYVDSYHEGYAWNDGELRGLRKALDGSGVELVVRHMDTKRYGDDAFKKAAGERLWAEMQTIKPDLVVASDDNAQQFFVVPFLKSTSTPVVFCGVNQDASPYGYPAANITGMVEVEAIKALVDDLKRLGGGERLAFVCDDSVTQRKVAAYYNRRYFNGRLQTYFARTMDELKRLFLEAQDKADLILLENFAAINDFDPGEAERFLLENLKRPTGSTLDFMDRFVVLALGKVPEEQGEWAGRTALAILGGASPADIPLAENEQARLAVNLRMAEAAGIVIPVGILRAASKVIGEDGKVKEKRLQP